MIDLIHSRINLEFSNTTIKLNLESHNNNMLMMNFKLLGINLQKWESLLSNK